MSSIKTVTNIFCAEPGEDKADFLGCDKVLPELSHDLKNYFVVIRAAAQRIRNNISTIELTSIENSFSSISRALDHALVCLDMARTFSASPSDDVDSISHFAIVDCLQEALQKYPFPAQKYAEYLHLDTLETDFIVKAKRHLIFISILCLIRNMMYAFYHRGGCHAYITLQRGNKKNSVRFEMSQTLQPKNNLFALGTPSLPGHGMQFIQHVMAELGGEVSFELTANELLVIVLLFPVLSIERS